MMTNMVQIHQSQLLLNGQAIPLLSGEVHYWRLQPYYWERCLQRANELGLNIVASYICWEFHEHEADKLDFTGATIPERNLVGFLELCRDMGFKVIIRPGPYIYSEWPQAGIPARLARYYRLHPLFLQAAESYIRQVTQILRPFFYSNDGPIILLQADNEIDSFSIFHGEQLGLYGGEGLFQEFLREKYGTIDRLNDAWRSSLNDFSDARATIKVKDPNPANQARSLDFRQFHHWCAQKIARWVVNAYRSAGVDIPIYLNTVHHCYSQNLRQMAQEFGLVGIDLYPANEFHTSENEHLNFLRNVSYASAVTQLPYIPEFQCGIWHGYHYHTQNLTANHYRLSCLTALMGGIVGWNWYMLVERDNWYYSPINARGFIRPELFEPMRKIASMFHEFNPAELQKLSATAITEDECHFGAEGMGHHSGVAKAVYEAGIPFKSYDPIKGDPDCRLLFYAGPDWLPRAQQAGLRQYVENGGTLVCFNSFPQFDETFRPFSALPWVAPDGSTFTKNYDLTLGLTSIQIKDSLSTFGAVPGAPIYAQQSKQQVANIYAEENQLLDNHEAGRSFIVGYQLEVGKGQLIFLGIAPTPEIVVAIHQLTSVPIYCQATTAKTLAALFRKSEQQYYLIALNLGDDARSVQVRLAPEIFANSSWLCTDLFSKDKETVFFSETPVLTIPVGRKDGTVWRLRYATTPADA
ncbi:MAG: beta-galactosidase [candidate division KSB1 bacterium]|nr:beta-galactosidase [candidate division KSB1 bacterium]